MKSTEEILAKINSPADLRLLEESELVSVCSSIRTLILEVMSKNPGHLGASLGAVELAVGIHYCFDTPRVKLIWDVGHQAYAHKILTGRRKDFSSIRKMNGISGFPKRSESLYDDFGTGHSSTSIAAALGMVLKDSKKMGIAVIGDGSLTGGMAFEGLNHLATTNANVLVIINDNDMSIDPNVGGLQKHLNGISPNNNFFTSLGLSYEGPFNGNDLNVVISQLKKQQSKSGPRVVHFRTQKGFGYAHSEDGDATHWHAPGKFEIETGYRVEGSDEYPKTYQRIVGDALCELAEENKNLMVITPAMASGSGLKEFEKKFSNQFIDVGIAEQHAITFSAGLAAVGKLPICVIYSTFLQRAYDQLIHDVALQNLPVVFLIDRAGLVGNDGATHQGAFDLASLNAIPNLTLYAPMDEEQLYNLILKIPSSIKGPVAIRYPRGRGVKMESVKKNADYTRNVLSISTGSEATILSVGAIGNEVKKAIQIVQEQGFDVAHYHLQKVKPLDLKELEQIAQKHQDLFIIEDGSKLAGIGSSILIWHSETNLKNNIRILAYPDKFIEHGTTEELYQLIGMDAKGIADFVLKNKSL